MPSYPLSTLGCTVNANGITAPPFSDIINSLVATFQSIYGSDVVLTADSQDYQWLAALAQGYNDQNNATVAAYLSFRPAYAQGAGLSSVVAINGIQRQSASPSTVTLSVFGVAGTYIVAGVVQDQNGYLWSLPANTTIPNAGVIAVTAICQTLGSISAPPNTVTIINNFQPGWQSVTNTAAAVVGAPVEQDAQLRQRQQVSTSLPALTPLESILSAIANVPGVTRYKIYENDNQATDVNGVPGNSISAVVLGGNIMAVAQAIENKKNPGTGTYGTTSVVVQDPAGIPVDISFFQLSLLPVYLTIFITPLSNYVAPTAAAISASVAAFINSLGIGQNLYFAWLWAPCQLDEDNNVVGQSYVVTGININTAPNPVVGGDIDPMFNQAVTCDPANVIVVVA